MKLIYNFLVMLILFIAVIFAASYAYHQIEGWRYLDSVYFTVITATTVGYGDFTPQTDTGKVLTIIFPFIGIGMAFYFFSLFGRYLLKKQLRTSLAKGGRIKNQRGIRRLNI